MSPAVHPIRTLIPALALAVATLPGTALAHGEAGEHVQEFEEHLDDYAADVQALSQQIDRVAAKHRAGDDDADEAAGELAHQWEEVKYHAAVEQVAPPLYAPIWQALIALRGAIQEDREAAKVAELGDRLKAALHQGLGGLKLKAQSDGPGRQGSGAAEDEGPHATLERIRSHLDKAVHEHAEGHADDAKSLIQDAYFHNFEGLEGDLIEQDADLVAELEEDFNAGLPSLINGGAPVSEVRDKVAAMKDKLERAEQLLEQAGEDRGEVF